MVAVALEGANQNFFQQREGGEHPKGDMGPGSVEHEQVHGRVRKLRVIEAVGLTGLTLLYIQKCCLTTLAQATPLRNLRFAFIRIYYASSDSPSLPMLSHIPVVAPSGLDLAAPARAAGWHGTITCRSLEVLCGAVLLRLGSHVIPVRLILNEPGIEPLLNYLADDLRASQYEEQVVVMQGFSPAQIAAYRARVRHASLRVHVCDYAAYSTWLKSRIGYIGSLAADSPVRLLLEEFLAFSLAPTPSQQAQHVNNHKGWGTEESFLIGDKGAGAVTMLLQHVHGPNQVENVENDKKYQKDGIDILVRGRTGGAAPKKIAVDVKSERFDSSHAYEDRFNRNIAESGWVHYSKMDVISSINLPTGEAFFSNFSVVKDSILSGRLKLKKKHGNAKGQSFQSLIWRMPIETLLDTFEESVFISFNDWLPSAYGGEFKSPSQVPARHAARKLVPQRSN